MKKIISLILVMVAAFSAITMPVKAEDKYPNVNVYIDGQELKPEQPAILVEGNTLVPLRAICEALDCKVNWVYDNEPIIIVKFAESAADLEIVRLEKDTLIKMEKRDDKEVPVTLKLEVPPINYNGHTMVPARAISEAVGAIVGWDGKNQAVCITTKYDNVWDYKDGYAVVEKDGKYGYIDHTGKEITPIIYDDAFDFNEDFAVVKLGDKFGYINTKGELLGDIRYDKAWDFMNGIAYVKIDNVFKFINTDGIESTYANEVPYYEIIDNCYVDSSDYSRKITADTLVFKTENASDENIEQNQNVNVENVDENSGKNNTENTSADETNDEGSNDVTTSADETNDEGSNDVTTSADETNDEGSNDVTTSTDETNDGLKGDVNIP